MGLRILNNADNDEAVFYCSTSGVAFGPVMENYEEAEEFSEWLRIDARRIPVDELINKYWSFRVWKEKEEEATCDHSADQ